MAKPRKLSDWPREFPGHNWYDKQEEQAVLGAVRKGSLFRYYGMHKPEHVEALEAAARKFYGMKYALAVSSGTGALFSSMAALGMGPGCEVIVPSYLWVSSVSAVVSCGAIPVLCEVDDSLTLDPRDLERKITPRTRLIMPIHMSGAPCDMDAIMTIAGRHQLSVLEDCAQANGATYHGKKVGTFGKIGIFSLQLNKNATSGEGGLVVTDDERLYLRAFSAHDMGAILKDGHLAMPEPFAVMWGQGRRMDEVRGALACAQLKKLPAIVRHMHASKQRIKALLDGTPGLAFRRIHDEDGDSSAALIILLEDADKAKRAAQTMRELGLTGICRLEDYSQHIYFNIPPLVHKTPTAPTGLPWNLPENSLSNYQYAKGACPNSDALFARALLIAVPSCLTSAQEKQAAAVIRYAVAGNAREA